MQARLYPQMADRAKTELSGYMPIVPISLHITKVIMILEDLMILGCLLILADY